MKNKKKPDAALQNEDETSNLGLDADHSSDEGTAAALFNNDNDRITGIKEGESDDDDAEEFDIYAPLDDK